MKLNSIICILFAAFFLTLFCFGNPVFAADFGTSSAAANSYRKNLSRLRTHPVTKSESFFENEITRFPGKASSLPLPLTTKQQIEQIEQTSIPQTVSQNKKSTNFSTPNSTMAKHSPYAVITAARQPNHVTPDLFGPTSFIDQIPRQLSQLHTALQEQPTQIIHAAKQVSPAIERRANSVSDSLESLRQRIHQVPQSIKTAISNALDQAGTKAHETAEKLRKTNRS